MSMTAVPISIRLVRALIAASSGNGDPSCLAKWCTRKYAPSAPSSSAATARSIDCSNASDADRVRELGDDDQCPNDRKPIFFTSASTPAARAAFLPGQAPAARCFLIAALTGPEHGLTRCSIPAGQNLDRHPEPHPRRLHGLRYLTASASPEAQASENVRHCRCERVAPRMVRREQHDRPLSALPLDNPVKRSDLLRGGQVALGCNRDR